MKPIPQAIATQPATAPRRLMTRPAVPLLMGLLAVALFAATVPMTRLANGSVAQPQLPPLFVALARAALAGACAALYLGLVRARLPRRHQAPWMLGVLLGGVLAFPVGMGWAVRHVPASHAATIIGALPLCTAVLAACWLGQRPGRWFWPASLAGAALVTGYAAWAAPAGVSGWGWPDAALGVGMGGAALAYVAGARLSRQMPAAHVVSWALVMALPITVPATVQLWPAGPVAWTAWAALIYVALASSWLGFFAWYAALARDPLRVSQVQLLQPFGSLALSALLLGEVVDTGMVVVAIAVLATVVIAQRR